MRHFPWLLLLALLVGIGMGVYYSWVVSPVQYVDTTPDSLRANFKDHLRAVFAGAYASTGNLERARIRLGLLKDPDLLKALDAQAQRMVASGDPYGRVEQIAQLAVDLRAGAPVAQAPSPSPLPAASRLPEQDTPLPVIPTGTLLSDLPSPTPGPSTEASLVVSSPTPRPTRTPTLRPGLPFGLVSQDTMCESGLAEGLLQVILLDTRRRQVPGKEIVTAWDGGEDHFFTGFKPELGSGYADFIMQAGTLYTVRIAAGGTPVTGVTPPSCTAQDGTVTTGQIKLTFQQGK